MLPGDHFQLSALFGHCLGGRELTHPRWHPFQGDPYSMTNWQQGMKTWLPSPSSGQLWMAILDLELSVWSAGPVVGPAWQLGFSLVPVVLPSPPSAGVDLKDLPCKHPAHAACLTLSRSLLSRILSPWQPCSGLFIWNCVYLHMIISCSSSSHYKIFEERNHSNGDDDGHRYFSALTTLKEPSVLELCLLGFGKLNKALLI